jgi:hypothetical protein
LGSGVDFKLRLLQAILQTPSAENSPELPAYQPSNHRPSSMSINSGLECSSQIIFDPWSPREIAHVLLSFGKISICVFHITVVTVAKYDDVVQLDSLMLHDRT